MKNHLFYFYVGLLCLLFFLAGPSFSCLCENCIEEDPEISNSNIINRRFCVSQAIGVLEGCISKWNKLCFKDRVLEQYNLHKDSNSDSFLAITSDEIENPIPFLMKNKEDAEKLLTKINNNLFKYPCEFERTFYYTARLVSHRAKFIFQVLMSTQEYFEWRVIPAMENIRQYTQ